MPVRKVGPNSYQWGNSGKVYSGKGAKAKAERQGRAIYSSGYRGSAESYKPPASAVSNAKRGLRLRKEWGRGGLSPSEAKSQGIDSGVTRARKISSGKVSRHDVRRMSAFNRHRKNYRPEKKMSDGGPTAGTIAWLLWGGTSGVNWAKKKSAAMNAEDYASESFEAETLRVQIYDTDLTMADVKKMLKDAGIKTKGSVRKIGNGYAYYFKFDSSHQSKFEKAFNKFGKAGNYEYEAEMPALTGKEELKTYEVSVPVLHYYGIGPVEAYDEDEAADEVRNNWSYWRTTIEDNGDWGGPLWRYSPITSHEPEASEIFASETFGDVDPDGPLAKALARAREELKKPKKPLQITRLPHPNQKTLMDYDAEDGSDSGCYDPDHFDCNSCFEICLDCHPSKIGGQDSIGENLCMDCVAHEMADKEPCKCDDNRRCIECVNCLGCEVQLYESGDYGMMCTGCAPLILNAEELTGDEDIKLGDVVRSYDFCLGGKVTNDDCYVEGIVEKIEPVEWCGPNCDHYHIKTIRRIFNGKPTTYEDYYFPVADPNQSAVRRVARWSAEDWGGDPEGILAKAVSRARMRSKEPRKPLKIEKLPHRDQKTLKDFEAVVIPKTSGYAERAAATQMAIEASEQQQKLLELQTLLNLKIISPEDVFAMMLGE